MDWRTKDLVRMAHQADLEVIGHYRKGVRFYADTRAPNGVEMTFSLSSGRPEDTRGDLNELSRMKRFARSNPAPQRVPVTPPVVEPPKEESAPPIAHSTPTKTKTLTMSKAKIVTQTPASPPGLTQAHDLTPTEFYRLCEWIKVQPLANIPSFDGMAMLASKHAGRGLADSTVREAMAATAIEEPEHWNLPKEPHIIVALELEKFMKSLGAEPSEAFLSLLKPVAQRGVVHG